MRPYSIMALSFHGRLLKGELRVADLLSDLKAAGIEGIEPATSLFVDRPDLEREFLAAARDTGLAMPCYDALGNLVNPDAAARQAVIDSLKRDLERCHEWGIPLAMVAGSRVHADFTPEESRRRVAEGMNELQPFAAQAGVGLLIESYGVDLNLHASSAQLAEVVGQCDPAVATTFDMGNFILGGDASVDLVETWLPRMSHVHVKDFARLPEGSTAGLPSADGHRYAGCRLGAGAVNVPAVVRKLRDLGYSGAMSLEMGGADLIPEVSADLAVLRAAAEG